MQATGVTLANATGVRLEFFKAGSKGLLKDDNYKPPPTLEPGEVASFLVDTSVDVFELMYNIQTFQGPMGGWVACDATKTVSVQGKNPFSTSINAFLQVDQKPPGYPTKFTFDVSRTGSKMSQWQINAKQSFSSKGSNQLLKRQIGAILLPPPDYCLRIRTRASRQGLASIVPLSMESQRPRPAQLSSSLYFGRCRRQKWPWSPTILDG